MQREAVGGAHLEDVELPRAAGRVARARQALALHHRVQQARFADVRAAGEGDLGERRAAGAARCRRRRRRTPRPRRAARIDCIAFMRALAPRSRSPCAASTRGHRPLAPAFIAGPSAAPRARFRRAPASSQPPGHRDEHDPERERRRRAPASARATAPRALRRQHTRRAPAAATAATTEATSVRPPTEDRARARRGVAGPDASARPDEQERHLHGARPRDRDADPDVPHRPAKEQRQRDERAQIDRAHDDRRARVAQRVEARAPSAGRPRPSRSPRPARSARAPSRARPARRTRRAGRA